MQKHLNTIVLLGRPNVGKSTLFNRLIRKRLAIEDHLAHTTRDVVTGVVTFGRGTAKRAVVIADTAGDDGASPPSELERLAAGQRAIVQQCAAHIVVVIDAKEGLLDEDRRIIRQVRKMNIPFSVVAAKADSHGSELSAAAEAAAAGTEIIAVSAIHNRGLLPLLTIMERYAKPWRPSNFERVVIIGRPNAGKSTLFNALVCDRVSLVSDIPGTTRDIVSYELPEHRLRLFDTAGLTRRGQAMRGLSRYSTLRLEEALELGDLAILCLDGRQRLAAQDAHIAEKAISRGLSVVIAVTKWDGDIATATNQEQLGERLRRRFHFAPWLPAVFVSAQTGLHLQELLVVGHEALAARAVKLGDAELSQFVASIIAHDERLRSLINITQVASSPPILLLTLRTPLHESLQRQIINRLREALKIGATPINYRVDLLKKRRPKAVARGRDGRKSGR